MTDRNDELEKALKSFDSACVNYPDAFDGAALSSEKLRELRDAKTKAADRIRELFHATQPVVTMEDVEMLQMFPQWALLIDAPEDVQNDLKKRYADLADKLAAHISAPRTEEGR